MRLPSILVSCLFLLGGSAAGFTASEIDLEDLPGLSLGASGPADGNETAENESDENGTVENGTDDNETGEGNHTLEGNSTEGNATDGGPDGNATEDTGAEGNETDDNSTAENGTTSADNGTSEPPPATDGSEPPEGPYEDLSMYDQGTFVGDADRTWSWRVESQTVQRLSVYFEFVPSVYAYSAEDLTIVLRDGAGNKLASLDGPGMSLGYDPIIEYEAQGTLHAAPGAWSLEVEAENTLADFEFEVRVVY